MQQERVEWHDLLALRRTCWWCGEQKHEPDTGTKGYKMLMFSDERGHLTAHLCEPCGVRYESARAEAEAEARRY